MTESSPFSPVVPVRPAAGYVGGKRNLARALVARINRVPHVTYAEPFVGMGGVFLRRDRRPQAEVINDAAGDVATFFRVLQEHHAYLVDLLRFRVTSRAEFDRLLATPPERLTDLQRAVRFLYLQRLAFGGQVSGRSFGVSPAQSARFNILQIEPLLADIHHRLAGVVIECLDWAAFVDRYDRPGTLFFLDPPYLGSEREYGAALFGRDQFERLAERLARLSGRFILTLNDHPGVRRLFAGFAIEEVGVTYMVGGGQRAKRVRELIISDRRDGG